MRNAVRVIREGAESLLDPVRRRILEQLREEPDSASGVAKRLGLPRQRVNYHVRALERAGLVQEVGRRQRRGLSERLVRATATHYLIAPEPAGAGALDPELMRDRFSASYQVAVAARTVREVGRLMELSAAAGKPLATLTLDTEIRFTTQRARDGFVDELTSALLSLAAKYHGAGSASRAYRVSLCTHPVYRAESDTVPEPR